MAQPPEFDPLPVIEMLLKAASAFHSASHKVGDLVQFSDPGMARPDMGLEKPMPAVVVAVFDDLSVFTGSPTDTGIRGVRIILPEIGVPYMDVEDAVYPAWHLEPYTGNRPHQQ